MSDQSLHDQKVTTMEFGSHFPCKYIPLRRLVLIAIPKLDKSAQIFISLSSARIMPPKYSLRNSCFLKGVDWKQDQRAENLRVHKRRGYSSFLPLPRTSKALLVAAGHCPERQREKPTEGRIRCLCVFPSVIQLFIIRNVQLIFVPIHKTRFLKCL